MARTRGIEFCGSSSSLAEMPALFPEDKEKSGQVVAPPTEHTGMKGTEPNGRTENQKRKSVTNKNGERRYACTKKQKKKPWLTGRKKKKIELTPSDLDDAGQSLSGETALELGSTRVRVIPELSRMNTRRQTKILRYEKALKSSDAQAPVASEVPTPEVPKPEVPKPRMEPEIIVVRVCDISQIPNITPPPFIVPCIRCDVPATIRLTCKHGICRRCELIKHWSANEEMCENCELIDELKRDNARMDKQLKKSLHVRKSTQPTTMASTEVVRQRCATLHAVILQLSGGVGTEDEMAEAIALMTQYLKRNTAVALGLRNSIIK